MKKLNLKKHFGRDCRIVVEHDDLNKTVDIIHDVLDLGEDSVEIRISKTEGITEPGKDNISCFLLEFGCVHEDYRLICNRLLVSEIDFRVELEDAFGQVFYKRLVS